MAEVMTIREAVARAKEEGLPVSEYTLRTWVKCGFIPIRRAGCKQLIYYPNLGSSKTILFPPQLCGGRWKEKNRCMTTWLFHC